MKIVRGTIVHTHTRTNLSLELVKIFAISKIPQPKNNKLETKNLSNSSKYFSKANAPAK